MADLMDDFTMNFMMACMTGAVAWAFHAAGMKDSWLFLVIGFIACSALLYRSGTYILKYSNHRLGLLGEQVVGQILDRLSSESVHVFHDLEVCEPGKKPWNIDHVVLTPAGVFSIETKTRRKPRGTAPGGQQAHKLIFDGQKLIFPHPMGSDRHGLDQACNNATWLADKLTALNGSPIPVTPVLVFPGWWVEGKGRGTVSVMNHKQLPGFLKGRAGTLSDERQRAITHQLEERCRIDLSKPVS